MWPAGSALAACRQGRPVRFYNVAGLVNDLIKAQQEYQLSRVMTAPLQAGGVVLDELGFIPFTRSALSSCSSSAQPSMNGSHVIITTNLRFAEWSSVMGGDERMSAALLDRLTHQGNHSGICRDLLSLSATAPAARRKGGGTSSPGRCLSCFRSAQLWQGNKHAYSKNVAVW